MKDYSVVIGAAEAAGKDYGTASGKVDTVISDLRMDERMVCSCSQKFRSTAGNAGYHSDLAHGSIPDAVAATRKAY
ncbi:hypothetical protein KCP74_12245 [Salmonella enterica subsp. enterica]|nr:hypothetical protein KCP74_12245 [Salmonella enterica subsp. enterica]